MRGLRLVYLSFPTPDLTGGQKMIMAHVTTLARAGFDAVLRFRAETPTPAWIDPGCPFEHRTVFDPDELLIAPDDAPNAIRTLVEAGARTVVFCQNHLATPLWTLPPGLLSRVDAYLACSRTVAASLQRRIPAAAVNVVPAFADERLFAPGRKRAEIVTTARKRPAEEGFIRRDFGQRHPAADAYDWTSLRTAPAAQVAATFGRAQVFLSLGRWEGLGLTPLEAMLSGCLVAGFPGVGGLEYATPSNGFWAPDDDLEGATARLCDAVDLVREGGPRYAAMKASAEETARTYSYSRFRQALIDYWAQTGRGGPR